MLLKPKHLQKGDTVGIISPSSPITTDFMNQFNHGIKTLSEFGLEVKLGKHIFDKYYYSAGKREDRISDFNTIWEDPQVKMVLMTIGGTSCLQLVDAIDYEMISMKPKIFAGISDGTILLNAIYANANLITFHGPDLIFTFGLEISPIIKDNLIKTLFTGQVGQLMPNPVWKYFGNQIVDYKQWRWLRQGKATGELIGGHSNCLIHLTLSGYGPDFSGKLLFLEGTDPLGRLDRQISSLRLHGVFEKINGLILGFFEGSKLDEKDQNRPVSDVVLEITEDYDFPILEIGELGHNVENYIFPIGCKATIDSEKNIFKIDESTVI
ncbi:MAG: LD-carboxypeptidase [Candidatus Thorarchaeota archaeon]